ncbi:hypothetical protein CXB51_034760 [Gossypium anomalum]|uniref:RNase H type-1 domain-containing protein n=1 Tax=Gossypium anomalum TaxID=47600 RepID=A0A8J6CHL6_9ROSI|nr:hypothetical protein CXB51_034760 [Gossypium anomalum]
MKSISEWKMMCKPKAQGVVADVINVESATWNLERRKLMVVNCRPFCRLLEVSVCHIFRNCWFTKPVLEGLGFDVSSINSGQSWETWLVTLFVNNGEEQYKWLAIIFWAVWQLRNKIYYQGGRQSVFGLVSFIKAYYTETSNVETAIATNIMQNDNAWNPPTMNVVKANFDASFNRQDHSSVAGIIFRDSEGHILAACTYPNKFVADPTTTEARACLQAMIVAEELGFRRLVVEGDSSTVVKKVQSLEGDKSSIAVLVKEIKEGAQRFEELTFRFVGRSGNQVAHTSAVEEKWWSSQRVWIEEASPRSYRGHGERPNASDLREQNEGCSDTDEESKRDGAAVLVIL